RYERELAQHALDAWFTVGGIKQEGALALARNARVGEPARLENRQLEFVIDHMIVLADLAMFAQHNRGAREQAVGASSLAGARRAEILVDERRVLARGFTIGLAAECFF